MGMPCDMSVAERSFGTPMSLVKADTELPEIKINNDMLRNTNTLSHFASATQLNLMSLSIPKAQCPTLKTLAFGNGKNRRRV